MKEAVAMWKPCLVHLDLFIICFQSKAAGLHAVGCTLQADRCPDFVFEAAGLPDDVLTYLKRALDGSSLSGTRPPNCSPHCAAARIQEMLLSVTLTCCGQAAGASC